MREIPSLEEFTSDLWNISKIDDPQIHYFMLTAFLKQHNNEVDYEGVPITYKLVKNKYIQYFNVWTAKFGSRDPKFVGKNDSLLGISEFISQQKYKEIFVTANMKTLYLFGNADFDELTKQYKEFANEITRTRDGSTEKHGSRDTSAQRTDRDPSNKRDSNSTHFREDFL